MAFSRVEELLDITLNSTKFLKIQILILDYFYTRFNDNLI